MLLQAIRHTLHRSRNVQSGDLHRQVVLFLLHHLLQCCSVLDLMDVEVDCLVVALEVVSLEVAHLLKKKTVAEVVRILLYLSIRCPSK